MEGSAQLRIGELARRTGIATELLRAWERRYGLLTPDRGRILLDGRDITDLPMYRRCRQGIGYLPQESSVFRKLTV